MTRTLKGFDGRHRCGCNADTSRRTFLSSASGTVITALFAAGALPVRLTSAAGMQGAERSYPIPTEDGVNIDQQNDLILVRYSNRVYAFSLACPHQNTALRWRPQDRHFQCPRHESRYQPDGTFVSGRATRNMDRFAIRRDGNNVVVDLNRLYRSDQQNTEWSAAAVTLL
jgi:nitrite reductase/ring-hydroxylating ferredoxin subunit